MVDFHLNFGDEFYAPEWSDPSWPLDAGQSIYVQVDCWNDADPDFGNVMENHEISGLAYNNISSTTVGAAKLNAVPDDFGRSGEIDYLPVR